MTDFENLNFKILDDLFKYIKRFKSHLLDIDYETYKDEDDFSFTNLFMIRIVDDPKKMKIYKNILLDKGHTEKDINHLFYFYLKSNYKHENKIFSWYEIDELDINYDDINTTTTYTIL